MTASRQRSSQSLQRSRGSYIRRAALMEGPSSRARLEDTPFPPTKVPFDPPGTGTRGGLVPTTAALGHSLEFAPSLKRSYILLFPGALAARERRSHGGAKRPIQPSAPPLIDLQAKIPIDFRSQGPAGVRWAITSTGTYHDPYRRPGTRRHKCRKATATAGSGKIFDRTAGPARRPAGAWGWRVVSRTSRDPEEILPPASGRHLELMPASCRSRIYQITEFPISHRQHHHELVERRIKLCINLTSRDEAALALTRTRTGSTLDRRAI